MAKFPPKGVTISIPTLIISVSAFTILIFLLLSDVSSPYTPWSCPSPTESETRTTEAEHIAASPEDIAWVKSAIRSNGLQMHPNIKRKGIFPRTRQNQLEELLNLKGVTPYTGEEARKHTAFPCPLQLLVEEHHSNYGEPWAGGRDAFEFLAESARVTPNSRVLEIGCGTLRVGQHFIRYLNPERYHCLERDELSILAALQYELPSQGLLYKQPLIVKGEEMEFSRFGEGLYDLIFASAVFMHMSESVVWIGLGRLAGRVKPLEGRIFVSHSINFCTHLGEERCMKRLSGMGLEYVGNHTHDSLLFNHYGEWFEFRRCKA